MTSGGPAADTQQRAREAVLGAFHAALAAADPAAALARQVSRQREFLQVADLHSVPLPGSAPIRVVGAGKATSRLAEGLIPLIADRPLSGTIVTRDGHAAALPHFDVWEAGHPLPDTRSLAAAAEALRVARACAPDDLMICLLSGGASALWTAPVPGVSLGDLRATTDALMRAGSPIAELNAVRKHLSRISGGQLALASAAGRILTLAVSDVLGSPPEVIGSGPTVPDPTTYDDALQVIRSRQVPTPDAVIRHLQRGARGEVPETGKPSHSRWSSCAYHVLLSIDNALDAARSYLLAAGYQTEIVSNRVEGEARIVAVQAVARAIALVEQGARHLALIWGGETTVTVTGAGRGGRCQEMALAAAVAIEGDPRLVVGCLATDGTDGPTDAAGGIVDGSSVRRMAVMGIDARELLHDNDSSAALAAIGDAVVTGPTGTNVTDLTMILID